jgi:hypothetical protein
MENDRGSAAGPVHKVMLGPRRSRAPADDPLQRPHAVDWSHRRGGGRTFAKAKAERSRQAVEFIFGSYSAPVPQAHAGRERESAPTATTPLVPFRTSCTSGAPTTTRRRPSEKVTIFRTLIGGFQDGEMAGRARAQTGSRSATSATRSGRPSARIEVTRADRNETTGSFAKEAKGSPGGRGVVGDGLHTDCHKPPGAPFLEARERWSTRRWPAVRFDKGLPYIRREGGRGAEGQLPVARRGADGIPAALTASYAKLRRALADAGKAKVAAAGQGPGRRLDPDTSFPPDEHHLGHLRGLLPARRLLALPPTRSTSTPRVTRWRRTAAAHRHEVIADHEEKPEALDVLYPSSSADGRRGPAVASW